MDPKETTWALTHEGSRERQVGRGKSLSNASQGRRGTLRSLLAVGGEAEGLGILASKLTVGGLSLRAAPCEGTEDPSCSHLHLTETNLPGPG